MAKKTFKQRTWLTASGGTTTDVKKGVALLAAEGKELDQVEIDRLVEAQKRRHEAAKARQMKNVRAAKAAKSGENK